MYYRVIPFSRTFDTYGLVYKIPESLIWIKLEGKIIEIPYRKEQILGLAIEEISEEKLNCKVENIKEVIRLVSEFEFLGCTQMQLIWFVAKHYITPIHHALGLYFPKNLLEKIHKDTFEKITPKEYIYTENIEVSLTDLQAEVYDKIYENTQQKKHLIYWVTGSGKTQIYVKIIAENLKQWKQTLLLIPEIILTSQIGKRIQDVFGEQVLLLHSGVTAAKKSQYWIDIHSWNAKVIIGTRSSLFYPYNNLGSIIIDEEHDQSYISDQAPRYHSCEVAEKLSELLDIPLVLGSWTPKIKTFYRAVKWEFQVLQLLEKYTD